MIKKNSLSFAFNVICLVNKVMLFVISVSVCMFVQSDRGWRRQENEGHTGGRSKGISEGRRERLSRWGSVFPKTTSHLEERVQQAWKPELGRQHKRMKAGPEQRGGRKKSLAAKGGDAIDGFAIWLFAWLHPVTPWWNRRTSVRTLKRNCGKMWRLRSLTRTKREWRKEKGWKTKDFSNPPFPQWPPPYTNTSPDTWWWS